MILLKASLHLNFFKKNDVAFLKGLPTLRAPKDGQDIRKDLFPAICAAQERYPHGLVVPDALLPAAVLDAARGGGKPRSGVR